VFWTGGATLVLLILGAALFALREFHAGEQMMK
jgi:hypothetical protein